MSEVADARGEEQSAAAGVYPNPTTGVFTLQLNNKKAGAAQVLILDSKGAAVEGEKVVLAEGAQSLSFNLSGKAAGLYLLQVRSESGVQTFRVYLRR